MTWDEWENHPAYYASMGLKITEWINWDDMSEEEKANNSKAYVTAGRLVTYEYKEAWKNLWKELSSEEKNSFKTLPNFNSEIFEDITGIKF